MSEEEFIEASEVPVDAGKAGTAEARSRTGGERAARARIDVFYPARDRTHACFEAAHGRLLIEATSDEGRQWPVNHRRQAEDYDTPAVANAHIA
jgi:hypothetical protein